jgi:hypothetical protein
MPDYLATRIHQMLGFPNVVVTHRYGCSPSSEDLNEPLKKINELDQMHNVYFPVDYVMPEYKVVCTPLNNKEPFKTYVDGIRMWKQALTNEQWYEISTTQNTIAIDYTTAIEDAIGILLHCNFFEGYHGSCSWLARLIGIPMKIHSGKPNLTSYCFPWRAQTREESVALLEKVKVRRDEYIDDLRRARFKRTASV